MNAQPHIQSRDCWCNPTVEVVEGQDVFQHDDPGMGNPPISYTQEEYDALQAERDSLRDLTRILRVECDAVVRQRDEAQMYERHNMVKLIALRGAVGRYLRFLHTDRHERDDDSLLSLLDDIEKLVGREEQ